MIKINIYDIEEIEQYEIVPYSLVFECAIMTMRKFQMTAKEMSRAFRLFNKRIKKLRKVIKKGNLIKLIETEKK